MLLGVFGDEIRQLVPGAPRQIVAGIRESFPDPTVLLGGQFLFVTNLEPRSVGGVESNGMILAVKNADGVVGLLTPTGSSFGGSKAG